MVLVSSLSWSVGTVLYRNAQLPVGPVAFNAVMMTFGGTWLLAGGTVFGEPARWHWHAGSLAAMVYLAVFRLGARVYGLLLAAQALAGGPRRHLRLRQSGRRGRSRLGGAR